MKKLLKKSGKKLLALMIAVLLIFPGFALTGCKDKKGFITVDVYSMLANYAGIQTGWFGKIVKDKFNMELNIIPTDDGIYATRAASGDLGDLILFGNNGAEYTDSIAGRLLMPWSEEFIQENAPYVWENMQDALNHNKKTFGGGQLIFGFGHDIALNKGDSAGLMYHPDLRFDLFSGLSEDLRDLDTLEDYLPALKAMQDAERTATSANDIYGLSLFSDWDGSSVMFVKALAALYGLEEFGFSFFDYSDNSVKPLLPTTNVTITSENINNYMYLRCLKFYYEANKLGILNPNSNTQGYNQVNEQYQNGKTLFGLFTWLGRDQYNTDARLADGKGMFIVPVNDSKTLINGMSTKGGDRAWAIGAECKYPERVMELINWLSTPEGVMTYQNGPKGLTWDYNEDGLPYLTEEGVDYLADNTLEVPEEWGGGTYDDGEYQMNNTTLHIDSRDPANGEKFRRQDWTTELEKEALTAVGDWQEYYNAASAEILLKDRMCIAPEASFVRASYTSVMAAQEVDTRGVIRQNSWLAMYAANDAAFYTLVNTMITEALDAGFADLAQFDVTQGALKKAAIEALAA